MQREFRHLGASPTYLLNSGLGLLFLLAAAVLLVIRRAAVQDVIAQLPELSQSVSVFLMLAIGGMAGMTLFTPCAVSLEGKNLWILQSMPVTGQQVLRAKLRMANLLTLPAAVIAGICCAAVTEHWAFVGLASVLFTLFVNLFGLREGLLHAKLDWTNEAQAVKQSLAVMLTMFGAWGAMLALGALWLMLLSEILLPQTYLLCISLAVLALDGWLLHWLKTSGAERFSHLT